MKGSNIAHWFQINSKNILVGVWKKKQKVLIKFKYFLKYLSQKWMATCENVMRVDTFDSSEYKKFWMWPK